VVPTQQKRLFGRSQIYPRLRLTTRRLYRMRFEVT